MAARSEAAAGARPEESRRTRVLAVLVPAAHLTVLTSFAVAQPLFDLLGKNAEFFAARASPPAEIVLFALAVTFALPLAVFAVELLAGLIHPAVRTGVHLAAVGFLAAVVILVGANPTDAGAALLIPVALLGGAAFALAYYRVGPVRTFLTVLTPAPLVFLVLFLFTGQVAKLVTPNEATAATVAVHARTPVVIVIFDEFPGVSLMDGHERIDRVSYPNFAALADDAIWFRNATTVSDFTTWASPAILSGRYPAHEQLPIAADYPQNLFTLLGGSYDISAFLPFPQLCPRSLCKTGEPAPSVTSRARSLISDVSVVYGHLLLPKDLRERLPSVEGKWRGFRAGNPGPTEGERQRAGRQKARDILADLIASRDERDQTFERFIASLDRSPGPTLRVLHVLYPHYPWDRLPSGRYYDPRRRVVGQHRGAVPDQIVRQAWQRHLLQVGFTDRLLGTVVRRLKELGTYERSLVIFTADHGASFNPDQDFRVFNIASAPDILFVPLFVKLPNEERGGTIVDRHVQTIDVLPTIADVLDVDVPWPLDGRSLLEGGTPAVRFLSKTGRIWKGRVADLEAARLRLVELQTETFGVGKDRPGLLGVGPNRELVGRPVTGLPTVAPGDVEGTFDRPGDLRAVDPDGAYLPALLTGTISVGSAARPLDLAVSLNGRIVAVSRSFQRGDKERFAFVVPEAAFRPGENKARAYWVRNVGGRLTLAQIACVGC